MKDDSVSLAVRRHVAPSADIAHKESLKIKQDRKFVKWPAFLLLFDNIPFNNVMRFTMQASPIPTPFAILKGPHCSHFENVETLLLEPLDAS